MKIAPLMEEMQNSPDITPPLLVHTGKHYDEKMAHYFFDDLGLPRSDMNLEVSSGSHAQQKAASMERFEELVVC